MFLKATRVAIAAVKASTETIAFVFFKTRFAVAAVKTCPEILAAYGKRTGIPNQHSQPQAAIPARHRAPTLILMRIPRLLS